MNTLSNFSAFALTRGEMKSVVGGACQVCSSGGPGGNSGTCGNFVFTKSQAKQFVSKMNSNGDGYNYSATCSFGS